MPEGRTAIISAASECRTDSQMQIRRAIRAAIVDLDGGHISPSPTFAYWSRTRFEHGHHLPSWGLVQGVAGLLAIGAAISAGPAAGRVIGAVTVDNVPGELLAAEGVCEAVPGDLSGLILVATRSPRSSGARRPRPGSSPAAPADACRARPPRPILISTANVKWSVGRRRVSGPSRRLGISRGRFRHPHG
jgi:hypothetical protein